MFFYQRNPQRWGRTNLEYNPKEKVPCLSFIWDTQLYTLTETHSHSLFSCLNTASNNRRIIFKRMLSLQADLHYNVLCSSRGRQGICSVKLAPPMLYFIRVFVGTLNYLGTEWVNFWILVFLDISSSSGFSLVCHLRKQHKYGVFFIAFYFLLYFVQ